MNAAHPSSFSAGRLVAIVVTHNRQAQLEITLARLLQSDKSHLAAVVVVDNASTDGTADLLATLHDPRLEVVRLARNLGGAGGFETGMRHAMQALSPDWLVLMDDDARPDAGTLARFHAEDRSGFSAWCAAVRHPDGRICDMNRPAVNPFWNRSALLRTALGRGRDGFHFHAPDYAPGKRRPIDVASFVGFFLSAQGVNRAGYPDGRLFIYGDDTLYSLRLRQAGGTIAFEPDLRFEHDFSTHSGDVKRFLPLWKSYYHHRNLLMVYRVAAGAMFWPALIFVLPKWAMKLRYHGGERRAFAGLMARAMRDGILQRVEVDHDTVLAWARKKPRR